MHALGRRPLLAAVVIVGLIATANLTAPPGQSVATGTAAPPPQPSFSVSARQGSLILAGHTFSARHEDDLQRQATQWFSGATLLTNFEPLGAVPEFWTTVTTAIPAVLREVQSGDAKLTQSTLEFDVVAADREAITQRIDELAATLPPDLTVRSDIVSVDADFSVRDACNAAINGLSVGPIGFEENSPVLLSSSLPRLERVAALAQGCAHLTLSITGHTDSSGNEDWNRSLSEQRAHVVANYLHSKGIDAQHLRAAGVGSGSPIASNRTRYGRSINRRIEIEFLDNNLDN